MFAAEHNASRPIGLVIFGVVLLCLRVYLVVLNAKKTKRSPKVRRIENIIAISLWSFIAIAVVLVVLFHRQ